MDTLIFLFFLFQDDFGQGMGNASYLPDDGGGLWNPINIAALVTAGLAGAAQLFRIWKERKDSQSEQATRITEKTIETSGTIEQINMDRTEKLFQQYELQLLKQQGLGDRMTIEVKKLQRVVSVLRTEVTRLRVENAYLKGIVDDNPEWSAKIDYKMIGAFMEDLQIKGSSDFLPDNTPELDPEHNR